MLLRTPTPVSADPAPARQSLEIVPQYRLRDSTGRTAVLDDLTGLVSALDQPTQVWHGVLPCTVEATADTAAGRLTAHLASRARPVCTLLLTVGAPTADTLPFPAVAEERRGDLTLEDGRLGSVLALTTWPSAISPDWLAAAASACTAVAIHLRPLPSSAAARLLRRRLASITSSAYVDDEAGRLTDPTLAVAARSADDLRHAVAGGSTRLVHTQVLFGLAADNADDLDTQQEAVRRALAPLLAAASVLHLEQAPAWTALSPSGAPLRWPWRLLDAASVAASLPHPIGPPQRRTPTGTLAGREPASGVPLVVDRFALHNPNRLVVGTSGAGKSYATKLELLRQLAAGVDAVVLDPEGEFGRLADVARGLTLAVGAEPAGLDPIGLACRAQLPPAEGLAVLTSWASALLGHALSSLDLALLDRALGVLRADRVASSPTAGDLLAVIADIGAYRPFAGTTLAARLDPAANGTVAALFAPNPDLADPPPLVVFDLRSVPARVRPAVMSCVLAWSWSRTVAGPTVRRRLVVIDEAHLLLEDPAAAELLAQFARRARKYGVALDVVTQRLSDFLTHPAGEAVLANTATKLLLGCEDRERAAVVRGLGLTLPEAHLLRPGVRGSGLLITPDLRTPIEIVADAAEHELASSGPR